jgi:hypothetical protein
VELVELFVSEVRHARLPYTRLGARVHSGQPASASRQSLPQRVHLQVHPGPC